MKSPPSLPKLSHASRDVLERSRSKANEPSSSRSGVRRDAGGSRQDRGDSEFEAFKDPQRSFNFDSKVAPKGARHAMSVPEQTRSGRAETQASTSRATSVELEAAWRRNAEDPSGKGKQVERASSAKDGVAKTGAPSYATLQGLVYGARGDDEGCYVWNADKMRREPLAQNVQQKIAPQQFTDALFAPAQQRGPVYAAGAALLADYARFMELIIRLPQLSEDALAASSVAPVSERNQTLEQMTSQFVRGLINGIVVEQAFDNALGPKTARVVAESLTRWCATQAQLSADHLPNTKVEMKILQGFERYDVIDAFQVIPPLLNNLMPSHIGVSSRDWGIVVGMLSRAWLGARKLREPNFDAELGAVRMLARLEESIGYASSAATSANSKKAVNFEQKQIFNGWVHNVRAWEKTRMYALLGREPAIENDNKIERYYAEMFPEMPAQTSLAAEEVRQRAARIFDLTNPSKQEQKSRKADRQEFIEMCDAIASRMRNASWDPGQIRDAFARVLGVYEHADPQAKL